jgi:type I restriction enzyme S subunit
LEGLEATEVLLSDVGYDNEVLRFDAEYFGKAVLAAIHRLHSVKAEALERLAFITDGIHTSLPFVEGGKVRVLSAKHPKENYIAAGPFECVTAEFHAQNPRTALRRNDVLISTVGTIGNAAVVTDDVLPANSDRHIGIIRVRSDGPSPFFLSTFLVSRFGRIQSVRETTGNVQPNLFISKIGRLLIPRFTRAFELRIAALVADAYKCRKQAVDVLGQAEQTLLHALGLDTWTPPDALSYVRSSCDAFAAGRLDAQFFAPGVEQLLARLGRDGLRLSDVAPARHERFEPTGSGNFDYIEIGSLGADGTAASERVAMAEAPSRATQHVRSGDVITSTVRPIRRLSALIAPHQDGAVCSSGFVVLQPQGISSEVLLTYLRLPLVCELMDLHTSATMYPAISETDLLALPIPAIPSGTQAQVQQAVRRSAQARQRATRLLDAAKRAVEMAIEDSEAAALAYLAAANPPETAA